jgi:hypothetical protein
MSEVKSFKLVGGDEIVAEVIGEVTKDMNCDGPIIAYVLRRPHILQFQPMGNGNLGLAFVPWTLSNPTIERIKIPVSQIVAEFEPADRVERQYLEQTSGISLAPATGSRIST